MRRELARAARSATATRYAAPIALTPGYCTLSMLFSDWSHTGRARPAGVERSPLLPRRRGAALADRSPGSRPSRTPRPTAWQPLQIWGMGIASQDLTGDGRPGGVPHQPGRQQAADAGRRRGSVPTYRGHRAATAASRRSGRTSGGDVLPSTAWHPEFADVNNDGLSDLLVTKGNVEAQTRPGDAAIRAICSSGSRTGSFVRGRAVGDRRLPARPGAAVVDLNLDGLLDMVIVHRRANVTLWRNVGRGDAAPGRADGPLDRRAVAAAGARTSTPSAPGST